MKAVRRSKVKRAANPVLAILWFDTEDFVNPESDDVPLRIANIMEKHGIRVVFKVVGEKLRALKRNGRDDVIEAMSHHDLGYHSNLHSIHPVISEYVGNSDWDSGAAEFERREGDGFREVRDTFGRELTCYGHPGLCWVPQAYPVLNKWKVPVYLDETLSITPVGERPFWYCNTLNLMCLGSNVLTLDAGVTTYDIPEDWLVRLRAEFLKRYRKLRASAVPGVISIYCHPTTYVTKVWWEKPNFLGENPQGMKYRRVAIKSRARTEKDFRDLERFIETASRLPGLRFITARDALEIYPDWTRDRKFTLEELRSLCRKGKGGINFQPIDGTWVSPAEVFSMVLQVLGTISRTGRTPSPVKPQQPLGPKRAVRTRSNRRRFGLSFFMEACENASEGIVRTGYLPDSVTVDGALLSAEDMFATACGALLSVTGSKKPKAINLVRGNFIVGKRVTLEGAKKDWAYQLNPKGFEAPMQTELARLQAWTMKPATPDLAGLNG